MCMQLVRRKRRPDVLLGPLQHLEMDFITPIECKHKTEKDYLLHATQYVFEGPLLRLVIVTDVLLAGSESKFNLHQKNSLLVID